MADPRFEEGLVRFNQKEYYECHEVIEALWLETPQSDPYRDLYKGVIQAAAALYQFDREILSGALSLYKTSRVYLNKYEPAALGLNVRSLIDQMDACFASLKKSDRREKIKLNPTLAPNLNFKQQISNQE